MSLEGPKFPERPAAKAEAPLPAPPSIEDALEDIEERFEEGPLEDRLEYHGVAHTEGVVRRGRAIAQALGLSEELARVADVALARHDTYQEWEEDAQEGGVVKRKRKAGSNETRSADEAIEWMKQYPQFFTPEHYEIVREAIDVTVPGFDPALKTVIQPKLTTESHPIARAVALADLGSAGMEPEVFRNEGAQLFAEENLDIVRAIRNAPSMEAIDEPIQQSYLARYRAWMNFQPTFAEGRKARLDAELEGLEPEQTERIRGLFSHFDESIEIAKQNAAEADTCSFQDMARRLVPDRFEETEPKAE
jgi:hypothetical protein